MAKRRVVVTGMGAVTPIGLSVDEFWQNVKAQKTGFSEITKFDTTNYKCKLAAEVKEFDAKNYMDAKEARRMELFSQYAVAAAKEAIEDAGLEMDQEDPYMAGCAIGSGVGSLQAIEREHTRLIEKGPGRVGPLFVPMMISNMAAGNVSIHFGLKGKSINVVTACATGTNTIGEAFRAIQYGEADIMVSGGTEGSICPTAIAGFTSLTALTAETDPERCSIPFDKERSGFVMGEGAAVVVLEELEHAKRRGAKIYAEVVGYGCSSDAYHITSPAEDGSGAARAMLNAVQDAGITVDEVNYINAHGTSTHHNDLFETRAIKLAFGAHAGEMKVNSTKSMVGHMLGAAGAIEFITCVKEIEEDYIHATVGYKVPDEELDLDYCKEPVSMEVQYALSNSLGFGGHNASILLKNVPLYLTKISMAADKEAAMSVLNISQIMEILPHRQPMLLIDSVEEIEYGVRAVAKKCVSFNEPFFAGHFPEEPVMPGVLIVEALAQTGAVAILGKDENRGKTAYFASINSAKFKRKVVPGDILTLETEIIKVKGPIGVGKATAKVGDEIACIAELTFAVE